MNQRMEKLLAAKARAEEAQQNALRRKKELCRAISAENRKQRTHRLCERGGHLESHLIQPELLTDQDVFSVIDKAFSSDEIKKMIKELVNTRSKQKPNETTSESPDKVLNGASGEALSETSGKIPSEASTEEENKESKRKKRQNMSCEISSAKSEIENTTIVPEPTNDAYTHPENL